MWRWTFILIAYTKARMDVNIVCVIILFSEQKDFKTRRNCSVHWHTCWTEDGSNFSTPSLEHKYIHGIQVHLFHKSLGNNRCLPNFCCKQQWLIFWIKPFASFPSSNIPTIQEVANISNYLLLIKQKQR